MRIEVKTSLLLTTQYEPMREQDQVELTNQRPGNRLKLLLQLKCHNKTLDIFQRVLKEILRSFAVNTLKVTGRPKSI